MMLEARTNAESESAMSRRSTALGTTIHKKKKHSTLMSTFEDEQRSLIADQSHDNMFKGGSLYSPDARDPKDKVESPQVEDLRSFDRRLGKASTKLMRGKSALVHGAE